MILGGFAWALFTRRLTLGTETSYVEARRAEERQGRLDAESVTRGMTGALTTLTTGVEGIAVNVGTLADAVDDLRTVIVDPQGRPLLTVAKPPESPRARRQ